VIAQEVTLLEIFNSGALAEGKQRLDDPGSIVDRRRAFQSGDVEVGSCSRKAEEEGG